MKISKDAAALMIERAVQWNGLINENIVGVQALCKNDDDLNFVRRASGAVMAEILLQIVTPIIKQYPDLKPDQLK